MPAGKPAATGRLTDEGCVDDLSTDDLSTEDLSTDGPWTKTRADPLVSGGDSYSKGAAVLDRIIFSIYLL